MSIAQVWIKEARRRPGCPLCGEPRTFRGYHQAKAAPSKCDILPNPAISVSPITTTIPDQLGHRADATIVAIMRRIRSTEVTHQITDPDITTASTKLSCHSPGFLRTYPRRIPLLSLPLNTFMCMDTAILPVVSAIVLFPSPSYLSAHTRTHTRAASDSGRYKYVLD
jgi:hypothetical protein